MLKNTPTVISFIQLQSNQNIFSHFPANTSVYFWVYYRTKYLAQLMIPWTADGAPLVFELHIAAAGLERPADGAPLAHPAQLHRLVELLLLPIRPLDSNHAGPGMTRWFSWWRGQACAHMKPLLLEWHPRSQTCKKEQPNAQSDSHLKFVEKNSFHYSLSNSPVTMKKRSHGQ